MKTSLRLAGVVILLLLSSVSTRSQSNAVQTPTFKAGVEFVEVDAIVTDEKGQFVGTLRAEDFQVFEDGKPQKIAVFSLVDIPVEVQPAGAVASLPIDPDVQASDRPSTGRIYVMVLDGLHTAAERAPLVKRAARAFVERYFSPHDVMAIVHTNRSSMTAQDFTGSKRLLLASIDRFVGQKLDSATIARNEEFFRTTPTERIADPFEMERGANARSTLQTLRQVAEWLGGVRGRRKSILFISEGIDYDITDVFNNRSATTVISETRDAISAATRSNVSMFTIDPRGLGGMLDPAVEVGMFADQSPDQPSTGDNGAKIDQGISYKTLQNELRLAQDSLRTLGEETNGFAVVGAIDAATAYERIVKENSSYYVLAYYPPSTRRDGRFHRIEVRTPNHPGLRIRARRGYVAPRGNPTPRVANAGTPPEVIEALNSPLPTSGIRLRVFASPFKGTSPNASVLVGAEIGGGGLTFGPDDRLEFTYIATDESAKIRASAADGFTLKLAPEVRTRVEERGLRVLKRLDMPPGRYQIRVAARSARTGAIGAVSYELEIPDFHKLPLSISGVILTSPSGTSTMTLRPDAQLKEIMAAPPVSLRSFPRSDEVQLVAEVYDNGGASPHVVDIETTVTAPDGEVKFRHSDERSSAEIGGARGGYLYSTRVPMTQLEPGSYVLTVEARSRLGPAASRQIPFEVAP